MFLKQINLLETGVLPVWSRLYKGYPSSPEMTEQIEIAPLAEYIGLAKQDQWREPTKI